MQASRNLLSSGALADIVAVELDNSFGFVLWVVSAIVLVGLGLLVPAFGLDRSFARDTRTTVRFAAYSALPALAMLPMHILGRVVQDGGVFWLVWGPVAVASFLAAPFLLGAFVVLAMWIVATWRGRTRSGSETGWVLVGAALACLGIANILLFLE